MPLPTREEINEYDDLDARRAAENFYVKDLAAAEKMFEEYPSRYQEDLMWMGPVAFRYYILAAFGISGTNLQRGRLRLLRGSLSRWNPA